MHKAWKVLCWNMRGINSDQKLLALCNAIDSSGCSVICLQETKRASFDKSFVRTFCPKLYDTFEVVPSQGASGVWSLYGIVRSLLEILSALNLLLWALSLLRCKLPNRGTCLIYMAHVMVLLGQPLPPGCLILTYRTTRTGSYVAFSIISEHQIIVTSPEGMLMTC